jgi:hypothetical protein
MVCASFRDPVKEDAINWVAVKLPTCWVKLLMVLPCIVWKNPEFVEKVDVTMLDALRNSV